MAGVEARTIAEGRFDAAFTHRLHDRDQVGGGAGELLVQEHVLAGLGELECRFRQFARREDDARDVEVLVGDEVVHAGVLARFWVVDVSVLQDLRLVLFAVGDYLHPLHLFEVVYQVRPLRPYGALVGDAQSYYSHL